MVLKTALCFILIDDDFVNNFLSSIVIEDAAGEAEITSFENPEKAIDYIKARYEAETKQTILFLDINMPVCSGWEFLDHFEKLSDKIKARFRIYMLSSSFDPTDLQRSKENKNVVDYIVKPLSEARVLSILSLLA